MMKLSLVLVFLAALSGCSHQPPTADSSALATNGQEDQTNLERLSFEAVHSIFEDSQGHFWFGSWHKGLARFDGNQMTYFTEKNGLGAKAPSSIQEDQNGHLWFRSENGISRLDGQKNISRAHADTKANHNWQSAADDLWLGWDADNKLEVQPGAYRYGGGQSSFLAFPLPAGEDSRFIHRVSTGAIKGQNGVIWFGTFEAAIGFDGQSFTVIGREEMGRKDDPRNVGIRGLFEDSKGNLWIADNGAGLFIYDGESVTNFTRKHGLDEDQVEGPSLHRAFAVAEDDHGSMWFGTIYSGVWRFDGETLTHFGPEQGMTSESIQVIYKDKRGDMWVGGEGVFKFNGTTFDRVF